MLSRSFFFAIATVLLSGCGATFSATPSNTTSSNVKINATDTSLCLGSMESPAIAPESYELQNFWGNSEIHPVFAGRVYPVSVSALEAGKPLTLVYSAMRDSDSDKSALARSGQVQSVEWHYRVDGGRERVAILSPQPGDPLETQAQATISIPSRARQNLEFWIVLVSSGNTTTTLEGKAAHAVLPIAPSEGPTVCFSKSWDTVLEHPISRGESFTLAYDVDRIYKQLQGTSYNGFTSWSAIVHVEFYDELDRRLQSVQLPVKVPDFPVLRPTFRVVEDTAKIVIWFTGTSLGGQVFDSEWGRNFVLPVDE